MERGFDTMSLSGDEAHSRFNKVFADLEVSKDEFGGSSKEYLNPWTQKDLRPEIKEKMLQKQSIDTQTGGAGTAGTALIPVYVDPAVVDRTDRMTPLTDLLPRRAVKGLTYDYIPLTAKNGAAFALEDQAIADQEDTYDRVSVNMKYLYAKGRITGQARAAMQGFIDPNALDLRVKVKSIKEAEEDAIINGDASTNPEEFDGLIQLITTNTTNKSSASVTLANIRAELATTFNANGMVTLAVTDASTLNYIKGLLLDIQRQPAPPAENLPFGIPGSFEFDGVTFIRDRYMPTTSGSRRILFLDMRYVFMALLQDVTYEELAQTADSYPYMLKEYLALVLTFEASCSQIYGIA
jgi:HK97 family phage major capsid protein